MAESRAQFPHVVRVRVRPPKEGVAVSLRFDTTYKNHFSHVVFTDSNGSAEVRSEDLLRMFDAERNMFIMDYGDPRRVFAGHVSARVLGQDEIRRAIEAYAMFSRHLSYPAGYESKLVFARESGQDPADVIVKVETE